MKTLISKTTLVLTISIVLSSYIFASATIFSYSNKTNAKNLPCTSSNLTENYEKAVSVTYYLEEEAYINDIPFSTNTVSAEYDYKEAMSVDFEFEEEQYIDDIPSIIN